MYLYLSDNKSRNKYAESLVFLHGSADGSDVHASSHRCNKNDIRQCRCLRRTDSEHLPGGNQKNLWTRPTLRFRSFEGGRRLHKPTWGVPVPRKLRVADTEVMTDKNRDEPKAPFNRRLVCGVSVMTSAKKGLEDLYVLE